MKKKKLLCKHLKYMQFSYIACCAFLACMYIHWWSKALCKKIRQGERLTDQCFVSWLPCRHPNPLYFHLNTTMSHIKVTKIRCAQLATRHPWISHDVWLRACLRRCEWVCRKEKRCDCIPSNPMTNSLMQANRQLNTNNIRLRRCMLKEMLCPKVNNKLKSIF